MDGPILHAIEIFYGKMVVLNYSLRDRISRCLENHTGNEPRTCEVLDGHTWELRSVEQPVDKIGLETVWSIGKAVGALALQILIPGIIDFATQLNTFRRYIRIHLNARNALLYCFALFS